MSTPEPERLEATVADDEAGERLDRFLARRFPRVSRARFQDLIAKGLVHVEGKAETEARRKMKPGEATSILLPAPAPALPAPQAIPLTILYEDDDLIVIDKPAGLVVHPAPGHQGGTLVNALLAHCGGSLSGIGGVSRPGIVHRLDKDTSGVMVVAKNDRAHRALSEQFAAHGRDGRLHRAYLAFVWGVPERRTGRIEAAIGRSTTNRQKMSVSRSGSARHAVTHYEVLEGFGSPPTVSLLRCRLETGRTHQIRVHMAHIGHPLLGDPIYGRSHAASAGKLGEEARKKLHDLGRQALHASELGFIHPVTGKPMRFESPLPADLASLREELNKKLSLRKSNAS
jgi:23S rRNA pseudouridine1911/1915/1917 synthase